MKWLVCFLSACLVAGTLCAGARGQEKNNLPATEQITNSAVPKPVQSPGVVGEMLAKSSHPGYMDPTEVKSVLDQMRFTEYRVKDLMTDGHERPVFSPDRQDPVCGMALPPGDSNVHTMYEGVEYNFCSEVCKQRFLLAPEHYLGAYSRQGSGSGRNSLES